MKTDILVNVIKNENIINLRMYNIEKYSILFFIYDIKSSLLLGISEIILSNSIIF